MSAPTTSAVTMLRTATAVVTSTPWSNAIRAATWLAPISRAISRSVANAVIDSAEDGARALIDPLSRRGATPADRPERRPPGSAPEPAVDAHDRQVDEIEAGVVRRAVAHVHAADVELAQRVERRDDLLARRIRAGAAQALDQHLGGGEAFEHRRREGVDVLGLGEVERFAHHRRGQRAFAREHLRDDRAARVFAHLLDRPGARVVRERDDLRRRACLSDRL